MSDLKIIWLCAKASNRKLWGSSKSYILLIVMLIYHYNSFAFFKPIAEWIGESPTLWVFPFFLGNPSMFIPFGAAAMLLYGNAPFIDGHTPFMQIRAGRRNWILGQLLFVFTSSFLYTLCQVLFSFLALLPNIQFSGDWGRVLFSIAESSGTFMEAGMEVGFSPSYELLELLSPAYAMFMAMLMYWLGTMFVACVILLVNLLTNRSSGLIVAALFISLAYFACYLGSFSIGMWLYHFSPISWSCISYLDWLKQEVLPSPTYAVIGYIVLILGLSIGSVLFYCRNDVDIHEGGE